MKISAKRIVLVAILLVIAIALAWCFVPWQTWRYRGPGTITDSGLISSPRFHIRFPAIPLNVSKVTSYTFHGAPSGSMSLQLYVQGAGERQRDELEKLNTEIETSLIEESTYLTPRIQVCAASGTPDSTEEKSRWVVMSGGGVAALWNVACIDRPISASATYTLTITTRSETGRPEFTIVPTLEGGGIELP